jgi:biopolymer transport protein ExbD
MSFISQEKLKGENGINLAPMIDFLFIMLMFFACLAISRVTTKNTEIELVKAMPSTGASLSPSESEYKVVNINISDEGVYTWMTGVRDYIMNTPEAIGEELNLQYRKGILPQDKFKTQVLLNIDKGATWEPILKAIFAIRDAGFEVRPVYLPEDPA